MRDIDRVKEIIAEIEVIYDRIKERAQSQGATFHGEDDHIITFPPGGFEHSYKLGGWGLDLRNLHENHPDILTDDDLKGLLTLSREAVQLLGDSRTELENLKHHVDMAEAFIDEFEDGE